MARSTSEVGSVGIVRFSDQGCSAGAWDRSNVTHSRNSYMSRPESHDDFGYQGFSEAGAERRLQRQRAVASGPVPRTAGGRQQARRAARGERRPDGVSFQEFEAMFISLFRKQKVTEAL